MLIDPTLRASHGLTREPAAEPVLSDLEAKQVGHFAILRRLGEGGMGVVYAAYDERLERRVAVKLLHATDHARLLREAQALARLSHPNVVQIYEVGESHGQIFVAMEHVEGPTLAAWLAAEPRDVAAIFEVFLQAGRGLLAAHESGLVHRDFKPGNVIVGVDGRTRVLDFGLARAGDSLSDGVIPRPPAPGADISLLSSPLTRTGVLLGTPAYMSPEQHVGAPVDARSDQFSFCAALFEALHGERPFAGETLYELSANVTAGRIRPTQPRPEVSQTVHAAIVRGLAPDAAARWPSMAELLEQIARARRDHLTLGDGRTGVWIGVGMLVISLIIMGLVQVLWEQPADITPVQHIRLAALVALVGVPLLALLLRRDQPTRQRQLIMLGIVMIVLSCVHRVVLWRAGLGIVAILCVESLTFVAAYSTAATMLRAPRIWLNVPILLIPVALVIEYGASPYLISCSWLLALVVTIHGWRRAAPAEA